MTLVTSNFTYKMGLCRTDSKLLTSLEDPDFINQRIAAVTPKRCESELRECLPEDVYRQLAENEFEPLQQSLRDLFAEWLEQ